jgi:hypothetical protein
MSTAAQERNRQRLKRAAVLWIVRDFAARLHGPSFAASETRVLTSGNDDKHARIAPSALIIGLFVLTI